jgi:hypothetical protein
LDTGAGDEGKAARDLQGPDEIRGREVEPGQNVPSLGEAIADHGERRRPIGILRGKPRLNRGPVLQDENKNQDEHDQAHQLGQGQEPSLGQTQKQGRLGQQRAVHRHIYDTPRPHE